jgi:hypothetical protein
VQLAFNKLSQQAQILKLLILVKEVFNTKVAKLKKKELQENKAVEAIKQKKAEKKEKGQTKIIKKLEKEKKRQTKTIELKEIRREQRKIIKEPKKEVFLKTLPVCTRTPKMLVISKILYQKFTFLTNNLKYLYQQSIRIS